MRWSPDRLRTLRNAPEGEDPEWGLFVRESRFRFGEELMYHLVPEVFLRLIHRNFPNLKSFSRVIDVHDYRNKHGLLRSHPPRTIQS